MNLVQSFLLRSERSVQRHEDAARSEPNATLTVSRRLRRVLPDPQPIHNSLGHKVTAKTRPKLVVRPGCEQTLEDVTDEAASSLN